MTHPADRRPRRGRPARRSRIRVVFAPAAAALALAAASGARADAPAPEETPPDLVGEVAIFGEEGVQIEAATKTAVPLSRAPASVTVITSQQIRESGARTIPELLTLVAGVNVRWNPMVQTIDVRGFGQNPFTSRVLLLIDGVPYNAPDKGGFPQNPALDFFVLQNIKRLELVRGPGSVLYGENAFWGVVNIVTLSGADLEGGRGELFAGSRETYSAGGIWGKKMGEGSVLASAKFLHSQFPMEFWFEENDSAVRASDVFVKGTWKGIEGSYYRHDASMDGFSEAFELPGLPPGATFHSIEDVEQTVHIASGSYDWTSAGKTWSFGADGSWAHRQGAHCAGCHAAPQKPDFSSTDEDHGYQLIGDFRVGYHGLERNDILVGVDARRIDAGDHEDELLQNGDHGLDVVTEYTKLAAYVQDQVQLHDRVSVVAGVRYDGENDIFPDRTSWRVAGVVNPTESLVVRAGYGTAFRFPNFSELYQDSWFLNVDTGFAAFPLAVFQPNPGLEPEQIRTFDTEAEYRFGPGVSAKASFFRSRLEDFMVLVIGLAPPPGAAFLRVENHPDEATVWGAELEVRFKLARGVSGFANYSFQDQEQEGDLRDSIGNPFEFVYAPEHKLNLAAYVGPFRGVRGALEMHWHGSYLGPSFYNQVLSNFTEFGVAELDDYALVHARLSYDLPWKVADAAQPVRVSVYGRNLLDERPRETFIGVDTRIAGREAFAELSIGF